MNLMGNKFENGAMNTPEIRNETSTSSDCGNQENETVTKKQSSNLDRPFLENGYEK